jgi:hypothetical protein
MPDFAYKMIQDLPTARTSFWLGAEQAPCGGAPPEPDCALVDVWEGWTWFDGTDATVNLDCGAVGCGERSVHRVVLVAWAVCVPLVPVPVCARASVCACMCACVCTSRRCVCAVPYRRRWCYSAIAAHVAGIWDVGEPKSVPLPGD